jgi:plasmid maintenance system antidote protein VapI
LLEAAETDFDVPVAVWLGLKAVVPVRVLAHYAGSIHLAVDALRKAPQGRPVLTPLDERAMEVAVLGDDMDELAEVPAADATLQELLSEVTIKQLVELQIPTPHALALSRGLRPLTPEQAAKVAPLAGTTPEVLLRANPPLPADVVRDLDAPEVRNLVSQLAAQRGLSDTDARLMAGYGAYALAARETGRGSVDWSARIVAYVRALLGDE